MKTATILSAFILVLSLTAAPGLWLAGESAYAGAPPPNHYLIYEVQNQIGPLGKLVTLTDQFGSGSFHVGIFAGFANPVDKNGEGIPDPITHLMAWQIIGQEPVRRVVVDNQFGTQVLHTKDALFLANPAVKNPDPLSQIPVRNHFKCYDAIGPPPGDIAVQLDDQFLSESVQLGSIRVFCNPAEKSHVNGTFPIVDDTQHLVCYDLLPPSSLIATAHLFDQFLPVILSDFQSVFLCVPSLKTDVVQSETPSWGKVKSIYR